MRNYFFIAMVAMAVTAFAGYFVWLVIKALYSVYSDWQLGKELDEIQAASEAKRRQKKAAGAKKLEEGPGDTTSSIVPPAS